MTQRGAWLWGLCALALAGCLTPTRAKLLRSLQEDHEEIADDEAMEMPFRARTPDLSPLVGSTRKDLFDQLGPGDCQPRGSGARCQWGFSTLPAQGDERPLRLEVDLDAQGNCQAARWTLVDD